MITTRANMSGREAHHSPQTSAEVKDGGTYIRSPIHLRGKVMN
jgi:hypothetical protein